MEYPRDFHRSRQRDRGADPYDRPQHFRRRGTWKAPGWRRRERMWHGAIMVAITAGIWIGLVAFDPPRTGSVARGGAPAGELAQVSAKFGLCHTGGGVDCVVDGDTFWVGGEKVRIADIDAPEPHPSRCAEEARLGAAATLRLGAATAALWSTWKQGS